MSTFLDKIFLKFSEKVTQMFEETFYELSYVEDESFWEVYFYNFKKLPFPGDFIDCSFICNYVEKANGCGVFWYEVKCFLYFRENMQVS